MRRNVDVLSLTCWLFLLSNRIYMNSMLPRLSPCLLTRKKSRTGLIIARLASAHMKNPSATYTLPIPTQVLRTVPSPPILTSPSSACSVGKVAGHVCPSWQTTHLWPSCSCACGTCIGRHRPRAESGPYHSRSAPASSCFGSATHFARSGTPLANSADATES